MDSYPKKIKNPAVVEAIVEIRFDTSTLPEVFFGRYLDLEAWRGYDQRRLGFYNLPPEIREGDPALLYVPILEAVGPDSASAVRLGSHVLSFHRKPPYPGWKSLRAEMETVARGLFKTAQDVKVSRLGLRYINTLSAERHPIRSVADLNLSLSVAGKPLAGNLNLNYRLPFRGGHCLVKIATPDFVQGELPADAAVYIDIDFFTDDEAEKGSNAEFVAAWILDAHSMAKDAFFSLFSSEQISQMREV